MQTSEQIKEIVKQKYSEIALQDKETNQSSCCGSGSCSKEVYNIMTDDYSGLQGYQPDADLGLGCGLPTQFARIKKGDVVIDLGSGAGNDAFIARNETGDTGKVIGIDFTPTMINKARANAEKLDEGYDTRDPHGILQQGKLHVGEFGAGQSACARHNKQRSQIAHEHCQNMLQAQGDCLRERHVALEREYAERPRFLGGLFRRFTCRFFCLSLRRDLLFFICHWHPFLKTH